MLACMIILDVLLLCVVAMLSRIDDRLAEIRRDNIRERLLPPTITS